MFEEMAVLVDAQGEVLDAIEVHVNNTKGYTAKAEKARSNWVRSKPERTQETSPAIYQGPWYPFLTCRSSAWPSMAAFQELHKTRKLMLQAGFDQLRTVCPGMGHTQPLGPSHRVASGCAACQYSCLSPDAEVHTLHITTCKRLDKWFLQGTTCHSRPDSH